MRLLQKRFTIALALLMIANLARVNAADLYILSAGVDHYANGGKLSGDLNDAHNTVNAFAYQKGKVFSEVYARTLLDRQATAAAFMKQFHDFSRIGKAGDYYVVFFSGHGGRSDNNTKWFFEPYDSRPVTGKQLLDAADVLVRQRKNVVIIIDACFSGQLRIEAKSYLNKYRNPGSGGLILLLSSSPNQESQALGNYSAFARAFADAMTGAADANRDGRITLTEVRNYARQRTNQLLRLNHNNARQDIVVAWSPSLSGELPLGALVRLPSANPAFNLARR